VRPDNSFFYDITYKAFESYQPLYIMAPSSQQNTSLLSNTDSKAALTVTQYITGLLAFASTTLPLFIYTTIPDKNIRDDLIAIREEMLGITASLHMIRVHLSLNRNIGFSKTSLIAESLASSLLRCVLLYSEIEATIKEIPMPGAPAPKIRERVVETFKQAKIAHIVPGLTDVNSILRLVANIVAW
jgi:hypothetical protein